MKFISFLFTILMMSEMSVGQIPLNFNHLTSDNGLTSNQTTCLLKDSQGFIWIGTDAGLNRFDGKLVKTFTHTIGDTTTLISNFINTLFEDNQHRLWIGTSSGLSILDTESSTFTNFRTLPAGNDSIDISKGVQAINLFQDKIWIATFNKIIVSCPDTLNFDIVAEELTPKTKRDPYFLPNKSIITNTAIWFLASTGPICFEDEKVFYNWDHNPGNWPIFKNKWVSALLNDGDSVLYYTTFQFPGMYAYKPANKSLDSIRFANVNDIWTQSLTRLSEELILGSSEHNGIYTFNTISQDINFSLPDTENPRSLSSNKTHQSLIDEQHTIFLATDGGLDYLNPTQPQLKIVSISQILREDMNVAIIEDIEGLLWFGTRNNGLYAYSPGTGKIEQFPLPGKYNRIWSIYYEDETLLLGTNGGLATFAIKTKQFTSLTNQIPDTIQKLTDHSSTFIFKDLSGSHWIAMYPYDLLKYNFQTKEYIHYTTEDTLHHLPGIGTITAGCLDEDGFLWLGYSGGHLSRINTSDNSIRNFKIKFTADNGIISSISSMALDGHGNLWIATTQSGLFKYNIALESFTSYDTRHNLSSNSLGSLVIDKNDNIWINASNGLNKLESSNENITVFNTADGFIHNQFNESPSFLSKDGTLYMICGRHLISLETEEHELNIHLPKLVFLSYKKSGEEFAIVPNNKPLIFYSSDRIITFEFSGINFIDPEKTLYAYKLDAYDEDWQMSSQPYVTYSSLEAGKYTLRIKTSNKQGELWSPETTMNIRVYGPFWLRGWFLACCALFFVLIGYGIYRYRLSHLKKLEAIRNKISRDLHDEIGSTLGSISIFSTAAERMKEDQYHEIISTLSLIGTNARLAMQNMSDIVWAINPANDTLKDLLYRLQIHAHKILEAKNIRLQFAIPENLYEAKLSLQQRRNIYLILCEAVHNVAKYSSATNCTITARIVNKQIHLQIRDDGLGFDPITKSPVGNGFINMKQRAEELNAIFTIFSEKLRGTILTLEFKHT